MNEVWIARGEFSHLYIGGKDTHLNVQAFEDGTAAWWVDGNKGTHLPTLKQATERALKSQLAEAARESLRSESEVRYLYGVWHSALIAVASAVSDPNKEPNDFLAAAERAKQAYSEAVREWYSHEIFLARGQFSNGKRG